MGIDGPVLCLQCQERYCMSCPVDALSIGPGGQIIVSPTICTSCNICEDNCPIGAIELFNEIVYVCDLCGVNPNCVQAFTEDAITWQHETVEHQSLSDCYQETHKMTPNQKRQWYLKHVGTEVRKKWREKHA
jgi:Fe-S-cluster-containing dehydrogenase component